VKFYILQEIASDPVKIEDLLRESIKQGDHSSTLNFSSLLIKDVPSAQKVMSLINEGASDDELLFKVAIRNFNKPQYLNLLSLELQKVLLGP